MSNFLEQLKSRMSEAHARLQEAERKLSAAQREHDAAKMEFAGWQNAVEIETRKGGTLQVAPVTNFTLTPTPVKNDEGEHQGVNKTDLIRNVIRQNPTGATPADIWKAVKGQIKHRPYVYSVLKRLKDGNKVSVRRGKYYLIATATDEQEEHPKTAVQ